MKRLLLFPLGLILLGLKLHEEGPGALLPPPVVTDAAAHIHRAVCK